MTPGTETAVGTGAPVQVTGGASAHGKDGLSMLGLVGFIVGGLVL